MSKGRPKGTLNKTTLLFQERLKASGVQIEKEIAQAIHSQNAEMLKALTGLLPYVTPRLKEIETDTKPPIDITPEDDDLSDEELLEIASGQKEN